MNIYIDWKYNNQTILTTKENDFHCASWTVRNWIEGELINLSLLAKNEAERKIFQFKAIPKINKLEVWINGTYHQHDLILPIKQEN